MCSLNRFNLVAIWLQTYLVCGGALESPWDSQLDQGGVPVLTNHLCVRRFLIFRFCIKQEKIIQRSMDVKNHYWYSKQCIFFFFILFPHIFYIILMFFSSKTNDSNLLYLNIWHLMWSEREAQQLESDNRNFSQTAKRKPCFLSRLLKNPFHHCT